MIEDTPVIVEVGGIVTGVVRFRMAMDENFVVAINLRLVHVLCRQYRQSAHEQGQHDWDGVETPHRRLS